MLIWRTKQEEKMLKTEIEMKGKRLKSFVRKITKWNGEKFIKGHKGNEM